MLNLTQRKHSLSFLDSNHSQSVCSDLIHHICPVRVTTWFTYEVAPRKKNYIQPRRLFIHQCLQSSYTQVVQATWQVGFAMDKQIGGTKVCLLLDTFKYRSIPTDEHDISIMRSLC